MSRRTFKTKEFEIATGWERGWGSGSYFYVCITPIHGDAVIFSNLLHKDPQMTLPELKSVVEEWTGVKNGYPRSLFPDLRSDEIAKDMSTKMEYTDWEKEKDFAK